jgi:hypothetical protein
MRKDARKEMEGWRVLVKNQSGLLVPDDAVMVSQSDAEQRAVDIAKREIRNLGETPPNGCQYWV